MPTLMQRIGALLPARKAAGLRIFRGFEASKVDRLTASWRAADSSIDQELRNDLRLLRRRSRDLARNNEYIKRFLRMVSANIVGKGMTLQARPTDFTPTGPVVDTLAANAIERHWWLWTKGGESDMAGRLSFWHSMRLQAEIAARDGEGLIRLHRGHGVYALRLEYLDIERLDWQMNRARSGTQNAVVMGVEIDVYCRPQAYHILQQMPTSYGGEPSGKSDRVPADEIIHFFLPSDAEQTRGYPWAHAAMRRLNDLQGYREAAVIAARIGASKMGFYTSETPDILPDGQDGEMPFTTATPGEFGVLPPGTTFQTFDPQYPHDQFADFTKATLRGISSALGVSYNTLANDLEGVNYSSIRTGVLEEREQWMQLQDWFCDQVVDRIFGEWLALALAAGAITFPSRNGLVALPLEKLSKFQEHTFMPRRWAWVDPLKDVQANLMAIEAGLTTVTDVSAANGVDIEDVLATKQREQLLAEQYGVEIGCKPEPAPADDAAEDQAEVDQANRGRRAVL